jgi:nuclear pore complex protein Nup155
MSTTPRHGGIGAGGVQQVLKEYWKDDFAPLRDAGNAVNEALREDELAHDADLYRRIAGAGPGSHAYFPAEPLGPDSSALSPTTPTVQPPSLPVPPLTSLKHIKSVPLPSVIVEKRQSARSHCLMGLLASASLAWMSVDNQLFLWSCDRQQTTSSTFCSFTVQSGQCIVSVGVVPPKKGAFLVPKPPGLLLSLFPHSSIFSGQH